MPYTYTYRCGACRTVSKHPSRLDARSTQTDHIRAVHHGRRPEDDRITENPPQYPGYELLTAIVRSKPALTVALALAAVLGYRIYQTLFP
ncbi:hypothetical protein [Kitasatospora sp. NBC_00315]|uniref:hypothetical protein n=1 Tax=Kitasatospora sp. NBC_00315 TaxID=2975963 RepID=UPI003254AEAD